MADFTVKLTISGDGTLAVKAVKEVESAEKSLGVTAKNTGAQTSQGFSVAASGAANLKAEVAQAQANVVKLLAAIGGAKALLAIAAATGGMSDAYANLSSKIRNVVSSEAELASVRSRTFEIAQRTRSDYESTVELYTRLTRATASLGTSQADNLRITETINKAFIVSGASAQEASNAIIQLAQGLSAGALRGDEFNSVAEQAPILMDLLAKSLGMTRGELRAYAAEGKITADIVTRALLEGGASVDAQFGKMQLTIAGASQQLKNATLEFVGSASQTSGAGQLVAATIAEVAAHFEMLVTIATAAGVAVTARMVAIAIANAALTLSQRASAASALAEAEAEVVKQRAMQALIPNVAALTAAEQRLALAQAAATAAGVGSTGALARMGASLLALVGGPIGVALIAIGALTAGIITMIRAEQDRQRAFDEGIAQMHASADAARNLAKAYTEISLVPFKPLPDFNTSFKAYSDGLDQIAEKQAQYNATRERLAAIEANIDAMHAVGPDAFIAIAQAEGEANALRSQLVDLKGALDDARSGSDALGSALGGILAPGFAQVGKAALDAAHDIAQSRAAVSSLNAVAGLFGASVPGIAAAIRNGLVKEIKDSNAANETMAKSIAEVEAKWKDYGLTQAQVLEKQREAARASLHYKNATDEVRRAEEAKMQAAIDHARAMEKTKEKTDEAAKAGVELVKNLKEQVATYGLSSTEVDRYKLAHAKLTPELRAQGEAAIAIREEWDKFAKVTAAAKKAVEDLTSGNADLDEQLAQGRDKLAGLSDARVKYNAALREANKLTREALALGPPTAAAQKEMEDRLRKLGEQRDQGGALDAMDAQATKISQIFSDLFEESPILKLTDDVGALQKALEEVSDPASEAFNPKKAQEYTKAIEAANVQIGVKMAGSYAALLGSVRAFTKEGSKSYQQISAGMAALQVVQDALAIRAAVIAVLTQGEGEPYSAWARMAAMAAAVAPFLASIGATLAGLGGGGGAPSAQSAEVRQASQGTGTVLGDASAKSESIANATEITANATQQLVAISHSMLDALQSLNAALGNAGVMLARGAINVDFGGALAGNQTAPIGSGIGNAIIGFFEGGKQSIIDQGIIIAGGMLSDMLNNVIVGAYQTVKTSGGLLHGDKTKDRLSGVSEEFAKQFQLVIGSIVDTVRAGATAIGVLPADIEKAIAAYRVEETRISLKGLSGEDQQKELQAVFSTIFDGLAGAVVPFISQFQRVGEGLGETLIRIATEVQVSQEAFKQLGLAVDQSDPEKFAQISDSLIEMVGGIDAFIEGMQSFVAKFAPEGHQFAMSSDALNTALQEVGLTLPTTRDGMWKLMQSLDATTEEGRKQIATLLRLANVADQYYSGLDEQAKKLADASAYLESLGIAGRGLSDFGKKLGSIHDSETKAIDAANLLAKARGAEGASALQLAAISQWAARQMGAAVRQLQADINREKADLYGDVPGSLDLINQKIGDLENAANSAASGIDSVREAGNNLFEEWTQGVKSVQDYLDSMLLGDLTNLTPEEQIAEAKKQLLDAQAAAMRGDTGALAKLPQLADAFLRLTRDSTASGGDWNTQVDWVRQLLQSVTGMSNPYTAPADQTGGGGNVTVNPSPELQALYAARDAALAEQYAEQRRVLAENLTQHLSDLATLLNVPIFELIQAQGINLRELATDLGANLDDITSKSVEVLGNMAVALGVPLGELVQQLGLSMPDLKQGLVDMTSQLGIDLGALTSGTAAQISATTTQLAALAGSLGTNLHDLSTALGVDLGKLTDVDSPIFLALKDNIGDMAPDIKTELTPLLDAVRDATSDEAKNLAIKALRDHVDDMAPDVKNQLAPFFDDIKPSKALDQLDYLKDIRDAAQAQALSLVAINNNLAEQNTKAGIPSYAIGTGYVDGDQLANIHHGEAVVPANVNAWFRSANWQLPRGAANDDGMLAAAVDALREEVVALRRENNLGHASTTRAVESGDRKAREQREETNRTLRSGTGGKSTRYGS